MELFPVVTDVIEAVDAEATEFALQYTGASWSGIQRELSRLQREPGKNGLRLLGNCHGHNFPPHENQSCAQCERRAACDLTSVFVSKDDLVWHTAVFARQPWALCHIFGQDARQQAADGLFTLHDGQLKPRGYYIIPNIEL